MPSLISSEEALVFRGGLQDLFDTVKRNIIIWKQPLVTYADPNNNTFPGYNETNSTNVTYTPISGQFLGQIIYKGNQKQNIFQEVKVSVDDGLVTIKVENDAKEFIKNGKTEQIIVDGNSYNLISNEWVQTYAGLQFFYFSLNRTN